MAAVVALLGGITALASYLRDDAASIDPVIALHASVIPPYVRHGSGFKVHGSSVVLSSRVPEFGSGFGFGSETVKRAGTLKRTGTVNRTMVRTLNLTRRTLNPERFFKVRS